MFEQWALGHKRLKKALYAVLVEIGSMRRAACLRALSADEVDDYRRVGLTNPIAIIPNGVDSAPLSSPEAFFNANPELLGKKIVLFLGRLHEKKGLDLLIRAWAGVAKKAEDFHLVIAGPDSNRTQAGLQKLTLDLKIVSRITFAGMLDKEMKWSALAAASLFVLPSHSEGFSVAVLEALSMSLPVVVSTACHIGEVVTHECGWVIPAEVRPLEEALGEFFSLSGRETERMGRRGHKLMHSRFHSSVIGMQMAEVYDWLQGAKKPSSVEIV